MSDRCPAYCQVELPVVPLLDVSFQLMFFLVISFHVGGSEGQFALSLPAGVWRAPTAVHGAPADETPALDLPSELVVTVRADAGDRLLLSIRDADNVVEVEDSRALTEQLVRKRGEQLGGKIRVSIEAKARIKYSGLVEALDACKRAGVANISFAPPTEG